MLTRNQKEEYRFLEKEVRKRDKYLNWISIIEKSIIVIVALVIVYFLILFCIFPEFLPQSGIILLVGMIYPIVAVIILLRLMNKAEDTTPSNDKLTIYHTYSIIDNITNYLNPKMADSIKEKEKFKNNAVKNAHSLLPIIEKNWYVGDFKLGKKILGETISEFKDRLFKRLILNFEGGSDAFLRKAEAVFYDFAVFLSSPTKEGLELINEMMKDIPESLVVERQSLWATLREQPLSIKMMFLFGIATIIVPTTTYFLGINYFNLTISNAFITTAPIAGAFLVGFLDQIFTILRSREKKEK